MGVAGALGEVAADALRRAEAGEANSGDLLPRGAAEPGLGPPGGLGPPRVLDSPVGWLPFGDVRADAPHRPPHHRYPRRVPSPLLEQHHQIPPRRVEPRSRDVVPSLIKTKPKMQIQSIHL